MSGFGQGSPGRLATWAIMGSMRVMVLVVRRISCEHRQLHDPNASTGATSAFQRVQRADKATGRAINSLRDDQKAAQAAAKRIAYDPQFALALAGATVNLDRHKINS